MASMESTAQVSRAFVALEGVRCLECGATYSKPVFGSTVERNPGCPVCCYVGWLPINAPDSGRAGGRLRLTTLRLSK
jgi:hypothetical protein